MVYNSKFQKNLRYIVKSYLKENEKKKKGRKKEKKRLIEVKLHSIVSPISLR